MIVLDQVSKRYDHGSDALREVSLTVPDRELLAVVGSSGSGKTTLLKVINRLLEPSTGSVYLDGVDVRQLAPAALRRRIGYVFQGIGLFPHMTVAANVEVVPRLLGWARERRAERVREMLKLVGLPPEDYGTRFPEELSGGQQQRVGVARALAGDPDMLLMDEPFGALDAITRSLLQEELLRLKAALRKTIVFVTHDIIEALILGDRIAVMNGGRLEQIAERRELLRHPATAFVETLLERVRSQMAALEGVMRDGK